MVLILLNYQVKEFEEVATFLPQVEEAVADVSKFSQVRITIELRICLLPNWLGSR
jgi:hypothetical protein